MDETTNEQPQAPEGAGGGSGADAPTQQQGGADTAAYWKAEAQKAFAARDEAKAKLREQQGAGRDSGNKPRQGDDGDMPAWAQQLVGTVTQLQETVGAVTKTTQAQQRQATVDAVLKSVPQSNRATAEAVLVGLEARGELALTGGDNPATTAQAAVAKLKQAHGGLFTQSGSPNTAIQRGPDGQYAWDQVQQASDMTPEMWSEAPQEVIGRITQPGRSGEGLNYTRAARGG